MFLLMYYHTNLLVMTNIERTLPYFYVIVNAVEVTPITSMEWYQHETILRLEVLLKASLIHQKLSQKSK